MSNLPVLFLYTIDFPYGETEPYLNNELPFLSQHFNKVVIVSENKVSKELELPENVEVHFLENMKITSSKKKLIFINIFLLIQIYIEEFISCNNKFYFLKRWKLTISELIQALLISEKIKNISQNNIRKELHYSFWMNAFPLALSILKKKNIINYFVFRVHGFDLYKERWKYGFIPYRKTNYKYASSVYPVSKLGLNYIRSNFSYSHKAICSYLGTKDWGTNPFSKEELVIVTCSSIVDLKRLNLLAEALCNINFSIKWFHFGDGKESDKTKLNVYLNKIPPNISLIFHGLVTQEQLFSFYLNNPVSVFINVSETEGLPVSIMEAISFGIPIIATNVGGTSEIVNDHTGVLVNKNISATELASVITNFKYSKYNTAESRIRVKQYWTDHFSASKNYGLFCDELQKLIT